MPAINSPAAFETPSGAAWHTIFKEKIVIFAEYYTIFRPMSGRLCILLFVLAAVLPLTRATAAWPGTYHPDRIPRDSLSKISEQRNQRLYDSIRVKSSRRAVPRLLYGWFFVRPRTDTAQNGRVLDEIGRASCRERV